MMQNVHIAGFTFAHEIIAAPLAVYDPQKLYLIHAGRRMKADLVPDSAFTRGLGGKVTVDTREVADDLGSIHSAVVRIAEAEIASGNKVLANASSGSRVFTVAVTMAAARPAIELYYVEQQSYHVQRNFSQGIERVTHLGAVRPSLREIPVDSQLCFVLMPFAEALRPLYDDVIAPAITSLDLRCTRADDLFDNRPIMDGVWENIRKSRVVLADLTGRNANVFYETGIAHALGKEVVLMTRTLDDVPFDLRHPRCILYADALRGSQKLDGDIRKTIKAVLDRTALTKVQMA